MDFFEICPFITFTLVQYIVHNILTSNIDEYCASSKEHCHKSLAYFILVQYIALRLRHTKEKIILKADTQKIYASQKLLAKIISALCDCLRPIPSNVVFLGVCQLLCKFPQRPKTGEWSPSL
jgi:hypothetical protein